MSFDGTISFGEPMADHTSFCVGGPAEVYLVPNSIRDVQRAISLSQKSKSTVFILGAGANILVADRGIAGIVMNMQNFCERRVSDGSLVCGAGLAVSDASAKAASNGLTGMEFIYSMPGSVGGSIWMNARCYGKSIAEIIEYVEFVDETGIVRIDRPERHEFAYKVSPYQKRPYVILRAGFRLEPGNREEILASMRGHQEDREKKGHFAAPSAGSIFKNNRLFGRPTGKIIDSLGLRGRRMGGAKISDLHANIIINAGGATATDISQLMTFVERRVHESFGHNLEREIILVGEWWPGIPSQDVSRHTKTDRTPPLQVPPD